MLSADVEIKVIIKDDTDPNGGFNGLIIFRTPYFFLFSSYFNMFSLFNYLCSFKQFQSHGAQNLYYDVINAIPIQTKNRQIVRTLFRRLINRCVLHKSSIWENPTLTIHSFQ